MRAYVYRNLYGKGYMGKITRIINGKLVDIDEHAPVLKPTETAARESRQDNRVRHRKDILQPNQVDFYKAYPDKAKELNPELRRLLS